MVRFPDDHPATGSGDLSMTLQTEICAMLHKQLVIHRPMGLVTSSAAFPHRFMFEDEVPGLLSMALGTRLIQSCQSQPACRFLDIVTVWIMTLHTVHFFLQDRMMGRKAKFGVHTHMTLEAGLRGLAGIYDQTMEGRSPTRFHVQTASSMTGFTAGVHPLCSGHRMNP